MIGVIMTVRVKPGKSNRFAELVEQLRRDVHANEPDTFVFEVLRDREHGQLFTFTEVFRDEAARERHAEAPYHKAMSAEGWSCVEGEPEIRVADPLGQFNTRGEVR